MSVKSILVAGAAIAFCAGAAAAQAPSNTQAPPAAASQRAAPPPGYGPGGPGFRGGRYFRGGDRGGDRGRGGFRHGPRLTREEREKRLDDAFARMDANHDGRVTFEEFRQAEERRKLERQHQMFQRFSGGQDSVTLDQLKARQAVREAERQDRFRGRPGGQDRRGPPPPATNTPPAR